MNRSADRRWLLGELPGSGSGEARLFRAPGRINIIGEHTDYTGGFVLPTTTASYTWVAARPRNDDNIVIRSINLGDEKQFSIEHLEANDATGWADYVRGVAAILRRRGVKLRGADLVIDSDIPIGGGLSSSAALEVSTALALLEISGETMSPQEVAIISQQAEIEYAGVNCGLMDQFAVSCCPKNHAVLLNCRNFSADPIRLPDELCFVVTDSGVRHSLSDGGYNNRTQECLEALHVLSSLVDNLDSLGTLRHEDLEKNKQALSETLYRRCRHIVAENQRVHAAYSALETGDLPTLGQLISASHSSLRDNFAVSCDEVDALVARADACDGVLGSRMVGAGFGGCVLSLLDRDRLSQAMRDIRDAETAATGKTPWMHVIEATEPASQVHLS